jgi:hypothetical protein
MPRSGSTLPIYLFPEQKQGAIPHPSWTLRDWLEYAGVQTAKEVAERWAQAEPAELNSRQNDISRFLKKGIRNRQVAIALIHVMRDIASERNRSAFSDTNFERDSYEFLRSEACTFRGVLSPSEIEQITGLEMVALRYKTRLDQLQSRVRPAPPDKLWGRADDYGRLQELLARSQKSILSLEGFAGNGKTSLAWHIARDAIIKAQLFRGLDWTTDKRIVVEKSGNLSHRNSDINQNNEDFSDEVWFSILRSMTSGFEWYDIIGEQDLHQLEAICYKKLRQDRYLIVIDNLETIQNNQDLLRRLSDLLGANSLSRALVTTREETRSQYIEPVHLSGIDTQQRIPFMRELLAKEANNLEDHKIGQLVEKTQGNPLYMQIAAARYCSAPTPSVFDDILDTLDGERTDKSFAQFFDPLLESIGPEASDIAMFVAMRHTAHDYDVRQFWAGQPYGKTADYGEAINRLRRFHLLSITEGIFSLHPLIVMFFKQAME